MCTVCQIGGTYNWHRYHKLFIQLFVIIRDNLLNLKRLMRRQIHSQAFVMQDLENSDFVSFLYVRLCFYGETLNKAKDFKPDTSKL